jgi:hypothetical protein
MCLFRKFANLVVSLSVLRKPKWKHRTEIAGREGLRMTGSGAGPIFALTVSECCVSRRLGKNFANPPKNRYLLTTLLTKSPTSMQCVAGTPKVSIVRERLQS